MPAYFLKHHRLAIIGSLPKGAANVRDGSKIKNKGMIIFILILYFYQKL